MFVQLVVFQKGTFLITIRLWERPSAQSGEYSRHCFYALMRAAEGGLVGSQISLIWHGLKLVGSC